MKKNKKYLSVDELEVGMIASEDVRYNGLGLLRQGAPLTQYSINKLRENYYFQKIQVYCSEEEIKHYDSGIRTKSVVEIEKSFNELSFDVENMYKSMENLTISNIEEVREFAEKIQEELRFTSSVIKNIVLHGSGDDTIYRHGVNVAALSYILGKWIGLNDNQLKLLLYSAVLHDFGKTKIDKEILDKLGPLTTKEFDVIKSHTVVGYDYIKKIPFLDKSVSYGVLMHHEKLDGSGYPLGVKGDKIPLFPRIVGIADVFDAVNSDRKYKKSKGPFEALELIKKESLEKLDYEYCNVFLKNVVNYYMGENVLLNNNKVCKIIQIDINDIERPLLLDGDEFIDLKNHKELYIERLVL